MISLAPTDDGWETVRVVNPDLAVLPVRGSHGRTSLSLAAVGTRARCLMATLGQNPFLGEGDLANSGRLTWRSPVA